MGSDVWDAAPSEASMLAPTRLPSPYGIAQCQPIQIVTNKQQLFNTENSSWKSSKKKNPKISRTCFVLPAKWPFANTERRHESVWWNATMYRWQNRLLRSGRSSDLINCEYIRQTWIFLYELGMIMRLCVCLPRVIESRAQPAPVAPPPIISTSYSSPLCNVFTCSLRGGNCRFTRGVAIAAAFTYNVIIIQIIKISDCATSMTISDQLHTIYGALSFVFSAHAARATPAQAPTAVTPAFRNLDAIFLHWILLTLRRQVLLQTLAMTQNGINIGSKLLGWNKRVETTINYMKLLILRLYESFISVCHSEQRIRMPYILLKDALKKNRFFFFAQQSVTL